MNVEPFWYIDDAQHVRWAVHVGPPGPESHRVVTFTSLVQQISTICVLEKEQHELTRYELLELLAHSKRQIVGRDRVAA